MIIKFHRNFQKRYRKLPQKIQVKVDETIGRFRNNPHDKDLYNHPLRGTLEGQRSISVTGDIRIVFIEYQNYAIVLMINVGSHAALYN